MICLLTGIDTKILPPGKWDNYCRNCVRLLKILLELSKCKNIFLTICVCRLYRAIEVSMNKKLSGISGCCTDVIFVAVLILHIVYRNFL